MSGIIIVKAKQQGLMSIVIMLLIVVYIPRLEAGTHGVRYERQTMSVRGGDYQDLASVQRSHYIRQQGQVRSPLVRQQLAMDHRKHSLHMRRAFVKRAYERSRRLQSRKFFGERRPRACNYKVERTIRRR